MGVRAQDTTARLAAAIAGALEGIVEALDRYDIATEGRRAVENVGEITRSAAVEGKTQAQSPEMRQLGEQMKTAGHKMGDVGHKVGETASHAKSSVQESVENARYAAMRAKENVRVRAEAVAETGRRARSAPRQITHELAEAFSAWKRALVTSIAMMAALAVFATIALIVLTIALVVGLNEVIGDPAGTFVVALIYLVIGGIAFAVSKSAKARAAQEREERMENMREEMRHVVRPVRDAFGGRGRINY